MRRVRATFWVEAVLAAACVIMAIVTLISREWIEAVFGVDPDGGSGALEWLIVGALAAAAVAAGLLARREWLRTRALATT